MRHSGNFYWFLCEFPMILAEFFLPGLIQIWIREKNFTYTIGSGCTSLLTKLACPPPSLQIYWSFPLPWNIKLECPLTVNSKQRRGDPACCYSCMIHISSRSVENAYTLSGDEDPVFGYGSGTLGPDLWKIFKIS